MLNPFGDDDDDFECNWILDRNFKVSFCAVDSMYRYHPPLEKDEFWDQIDPQLAYTVASERYRLPDGWHGSLHNLAISSHSYEIVPPHSISDNEIHRRVDAVNGSTRNANDSNQSLYSNMPIGKCYNSTNFDVSSMTIMFLFQ